MSQEREPAGDIGLGLRGSWIELEVPTSANEAEFRELVRRRVLNPNMGAGGGSSSDFAPPMLVRDLRSGRAVGIVENNMLPGGACAFVIFLDPDRSRAGIGTEAIAMYISHLFDQGARLVTAEVLEFNSAMIRVFSKVHIEPQARLRQHVYVAGRYWDLLVYSWDRAEWTEKVVERYRGILPGGSRPPSAIGVSRRGARAKPDS